jgi:nicotinate phosphoribosyltransferase
MIIKSLLDVDLYKYTMMQLVYFKHKENQVEYTFRNRTEDVYLGEHININELNEEFKFVSNLKLKNDELDYLESMGLFKPEFLEYLKGFSLPLIQAEDVLKSFKIQYEGDWCDFILWETIVLSIVNEMYHKSFWDGTIEWVTKHQEDGLSNLNKKINKLRLNGSVNKFTEFGTRRRFSRVWQDKVVGHLTEQQRTRDIGFQGTSNIYLSKKHDIPCVGTFAHEMPMVYSGIYNDNLITSHRVMLSDWWEFYGKKLSIALTDTYGSDYFFSDFNMEQSINWSGLRQDSGDPFEFGDKAVSFYDNKLIDPKTKRVVFSDGLNVDKIIKLGQSFNDKLDVSFGWGTNLTNDVGFKTLSLVVKATKSNGNGTVKLSDNLNKSLGSEEDVTRFKEEFNYTNTKKEELKN